MKKNLFLFVALAILCSCETTTQPDVQENELNYRVNGELFTADKTDNTNPLVLPGVDITYYLTPPLQSTESYPHYSFYLQGFSRDQATISFISQSVKEINVTYPIIWNSVILINKNEPYYGKQGTFMLTEIDSVHQRVAGIFSFIAYTRDSSKSVTITDGSFKAKYKSPK
ncbi:MAG: hypothetical protein V4642_09980 [Bacteroidota bacterium]